MALGSPLRQWIALNRSTNMLASTRRQIPEEKQALIDASQAFNDKCEENAGTILPYISTRASAADINSIRLALGE